MSNGWSKHSGRELLSLDNRLQSVLNEVLRICDCSIIEGHRSPERQQILFDTGKSQLPPGKSKHNKFPSEAVDLAPYPIDWKDRERFTLFAGLVIGVGAILGYNIRWGGDWDQDWKVKDNNFDDLVHFEILD